MGQVSSRLRRIGAPDGYTAGGYAHWCPACESMHAFAVDEPFYNGAKWSFDGNLEAPTFAPSMNIRINMPGERGYQRDAGSSVCHYFLRAGVIEFLTDCTHDLKGQRVPLPELPSHLRDAAGR